MKTLRSMKPYCMVLAIGLMGSLAACAAAVPPKELVEARSEYAKASGGTTNQLNPAQLHVAKESLDLAEAAFADDPSSDETRDRAYVALRKTQLAEAQGRLLQQETDRDKAKADLQATQLARGAKTEADLKDTKNALTNEQNRGAMTAQQLQQERERRMEADKRAKDALDALAKASIPVKEEPRGMVITLSGQVLFASAKSDLMPAAFAPLDNVVTALKAAPDRSVLIEGHTDSQGGLAYNMDLAQRRAESVRGYFVSHGIPSDAVKASGIGPNRPVADNASPEGRANNRRVEIIVSPAEKK
ncbi:MAG: outer membrane protein [Myxococcaceae bacterium]|nr:outer membrane protein [Myxococcaceae bacterium]